MKAAVMQPYFFPYLGYYQLIYAVDFFVIYDDVNYIKKGWINRNYLLANNKKQRITMELRGSSQNKLINQLEIGNNLKKILLTIHHLYSKAPFYISVSELLQRIFSYSNRNLANFLMQSIVQTCSYIGINKNIILSSSLSISHDLTGEERIIEICKSLGASTYVNLSGGIDLYRKQSFSDQNIDLQFIKMDEISYPQFNSPFVPNLSIIDVLMFNRTSVIQNFLGNYKQF